MGLTNRPDWLVPGIQAVDTTNGVTVNVLAVGPPYQVTDFRTAFVVPLGGGIGWEAVYEALRPASKKATS